MNIMSSASARVNNQGSLWEEDEIKALIAVCAWRDWHRKNKGFVKIYYNVYAHVLNVLKYNVIPSS